MSKLRTYKTYAKQLTTYFGASIIPMALSLIANPWIAKNMNPEDYAISGYYTSFSSLIQPIIAFYMIHYYIKEYFRLEESARQKLFAVIAKACMWFSGAVSVLCFLALFGYLKFFNSTLAFPISPFLGLMVFAIPLTGLLNLKLTRLRMERRSTAYFVLSSSNGVLNVAMTLLLVVWLKWGAFGKLLGPLLCNSIVFLVMVVMYRDTWRVRTTFKEFKTVFLFCLPLALSAMLGYFTQGFSTTYLESLGQTMQYGYYVVGVSIAAYLSTFTTAIGNTFQPDLYESTIRRQWRKFAKFCILQIGSFLIIALIFIALAPYIISLLTAGRYVASTPFAQIIALSSVTSGIYYLINNYSIATNRPRLYLYTSILGSIFIVVGLPFFVNRWSFYGGAWMTVISFLAFSIINLVLLLFTKAKQS